MAGMPVEGGKAPAFSATDTHGKKVSLKDFAGKKNVVLYFYPRDLTPGCTTQACGFRDDWKELSAADTVVLGVSKDDAASHAKFVAKHNLPFTLLCDEDHALADKYGVWGEKTLYGKKYMGMNRSTFLIDKAGVVRKVWPKAKPAGHSAEVLAFVRENLK